MAHNSEPTTVTTTTNKQLACACRPLLHDHIIPTGCSMDETAAEEKGDEIRVEQGQAMGCSSARDGVVMTLKIKTERRKTTGTEL
eukprot:scaffold682_cov105-Skeletonema_dohrnii-CCMP3373.AAC.19